LPTGGLAGAPRHASDLGYLVGRLIGFNDRHFRVFILDNVFYQ
jgi:hypothetical protein